MTDRDSEDKAFLLLVAAVTLAFALILWPLFDAILWGTIIAILFTPVYRRLCRLMRQRRTPAALATVALVVVIVIVPVTLVAAMLAQEATSLIARIQSGELNPGRAWRQAFAALPSWVIDLLNRFGLGNLDAVQQRITQGLLRGSQFLAAQAVSIGQVTFGVLFGLAVMLYLLFFLLRDSDSLLRQLRAAIPLRPDRLVALAEKFTVVIRATVKGNIVVAIVQGALGGLIFWLLGIHGPVMWAVVMAVLSLLPAVGAAAAAGGQGHAHAGLRGADLHARRHRDLRRQRLRDRAGDRRDVHRGVGHLRVFAPIRLKRPRADSPLRATHSERHGPAGRIG
jgi:predicted PurR-regulated permease PerM